VDTYQVVDSIVKTRPKRLHSLLLMSMSLIYSHHRDVSFLSKTSPASELLGSLQGISVSGRRSSEKWTIFVKNTSNEAGIALRTYQRKSCKANTHHANTFYEYSLHSIWTLGILVSSKSQDHDNILHGSLVFSSVHFKWPPAVSETTSPCFVVNKMHIARLASKGG
jgi:hypothetical protein